MVKTNLKNRIMEIIYSYCFLLPALLLIIASIIYPLLQSFLMSFQNINLLNIDQRNYVGFNNYYQLLNDPQFNRSLRTTIIFVTIVVPIQSAIALILATLLNQIVRLKAFFRTIYFIPYVTSTVAVTVVFMRLFTRGGILTNFFTKFGIPNVTWFANMSLALPFLSIIYVWMNVGFYTLLFLTGLQTIPAELYEAAAIDGANFFQKFRNITIPMLRPFTLLVLATGIISAFQIFDQAYVLSRGGTLGSPAGATMTMVVYIYAQAFRYNNLGYGNAAAVLLFFIVLGITLLLRRGFKEEIG